MESTDRNILALVVLIFVVSCLAFGLNLLAAIGVSFTALCVGFGYVESVLVRKFVNPESNTLETTQDQKPNV